MKLTVSALNAARALLPDVEQWLARRGSSPCIATVAESEYAPLTMVRVSFRAFGVISATGETRIEWALSAPRPIRLEL